MTILAILFAASLYCFAEGIILGLLQDHLSTVYYGIASTVFYILGMLWWKWNNSA